MQKFPSKYFSTTVSYRHSFQGQEKDDEIKGEGNSMNYKYRMHDTRVGRFFAVDPLAACFPWMSAYQFGGNILIAAIEFEGAESKIVVQEMNSEGAVVIKSVTNYDIVESTTYYPNPTTGIPVSTPSTYDQRGPLGEGTYIVTYMPDGTFSEQWIPAEGNSVNPFSSTGISQSRWIDPESNFMGLETRLNARLIEKMTEDGLVELGFNEKQVQKDVHVLETDNPALKGKFATFTNEKVAEKYSGNWNSSSHSSPHKSNKSKTSTSLTGGFVLKYYDGGLSTTDDIKGHIGLIHSGSIDHAAEAIRAVLGSNENIGLDNAKTYKRLQEAKK